MPYHYTNIDTLKSNPLRYQVSQSYCLPEQQAVAQLMQQLDFDAEQEQRIYQRAKDLVTKLRATKKKQYSVDALMHEFSLGCDEGIALMCLSEALLRIPDNTTRYELIHDKLKEGDWHSHIKKSSSLFINAASYGLMLGTKVMQHFSEEELSSALSRTFSKLSAPTMRLAIEFAMKVLGNQFVTGETIELALEKIKPKEQAGYCFSFDMLGEAAMTMQDADKYLQDYEQAIHAVGKDSQGKSLYDANSVSVKLSAIHPRYSRANRQRVLDELYPRLKNLCLLAKKYNIALNIDAEEAARLEISLELLENLLTDPDLAGFDGIGFVVQAYSKRCPFVLDYLIQLTRQHQRKLMVRLVKGAYWDSEVKLAQAEGIDGFPVFTRKLHTDISYLSCAKKLFAAQDVIYPQFATHNVQTLATIAELGQDKVYEFQCLHGMGETLYDNIAGAAEWNKRVRVYAPVGTHKTLLAYLVRRLLENGANSSFVHQLVDPNISIDQLISPPWKKYAQTQGQPNLQIKTSAQLFPHRENSKGFNLNDEITLGSLGENLAQTQYGNAHSLCVLPFNNTAAIPLHNPANTEQQLAEVAFIEAESIPEIVQIAKQSEWHSIPVQQRAEILEKAAALYQENSGLLIKLAIEEAGKTLANAIGELREAVDFLRYYAEQIRFLAQQEKLAPPLGTALCISPWNFPLAIFTGQVSAALAAGNSVVAKPAEQTSLIAYYAVKLLHQAGVTEDALQLVLGKGDIGASLVKQHFNATLFTGSTEVAQLINQELITHDNNPVLIAETGGMNCMVIDSSALLEQVVADVLSSAFDSAGQRCSALRILLVQEEIADRLYTMLSEAMQELKVGNPQYLHTDIGPVIDSEAQQNLLHYQQQIRKMAKRYVELDISDVKDKGYFVAPSLYHLTSLNVLQREVFGPILHFISYKKAALADILQTINQKGYALTGGCHSRIKSAVDFVEKSLSCGNFYINRNIVGAVVGVQPFGGYGLSGTGPKAGGELYVQRLTQAENYYSSQTDTEKVLASITGEKNSIDYKAASVLLLGGDLDQALAAYKHLSAAGFTVLLEKDHPLLEQQLTNTAIWAKSSLCQKAIYLSELSIEKKQTLSRDNPVIISFYDWQKQQDLTLLYQEFSRSENIAAAGGNASLMASEEL